jgi:hypothetical protein
MKIGWGPHQEKMVEICETNPTLPEWQSEWAVRDGILRNEPTLPKWQ